ncbi:glycosyl hydrolase family 47 [Oesophagostomum dentatum]|uniref:alpha-1,2-Mannosidase n=1 Tax=Oesophagostomum dentatum TaxID=61180 RepID=A0A0B1T5Y3_OESDE|nr:glycosyl hydrolase family 47 [Oesophagostomum dentatum]
MFYHAYNGYLNHAFPLDELKPISCKGQDTWGSFSLSLVDALDTLIVMGNTTEFKRAVNLVLKSVRTDANVNVSVFETNIRIVGGLLSAHMLSGRVEGMVLEDGWPCSGPLLRLAEAMAARLLPAFNTALIVKFSGMVLEDGWPCSGPLLRLAEAMAARLLPAFNTETGMPYGTVNLKYGVPKRETPVTCTAAIGTIIVEFGTLSRLTGDPRYERVALRALESLWRTRSSIGLVGNHINVRTGQWTATDTGIGAGVDSYFEYLVKGALLLQRPALMEQFREYQAAINRYVRKGDWFLWVNMNKATVSLPIFQSLEAFWPGLLAMIGEVEDASRIMLQYSQVVRQYGFPPEFYNIQNSISEKRSAFPLRPELVESLMYLYRATEDPHYLELGAQVVDAIEHSAKTSCGYATINNVNDHSIEDRMESFFLAETTKYLYLLFDPKNFIHNDGLKARIVDTPNGECVIYGNGSGAGLTAAQFEEIGFEIDESFLKNNSNASVEVKMEEVPSEMDGAGIEGNETSEVNDTDTEETDSAVYTEEVKSDKSAEQKPADNRSSDDTSKKKTENPESDTATHSETVNTGPTMEKRSEDGSTTQAGTEKETQHANKQKVDSAEEKQRVEPPPGDQEKSKTKEIPHDGDDAAVGVSEENSAQIPPPPLESPEGVLRIIGAVPPDAFIVPSMPPVRGAAVKAWKTKMTQKDLLKKIRSLIHQARLHDEEKLEQGEASNTADKLVSTMVKIHSDYADLIREAKELDDEYFEEMKLRMERIKMAAMIPVVTAVCVVGAVFIIAFLIISNVNSVSAPFEYNLWD